jgi:hypothetical protein
MLFVNESVVVVVVVVVDDELVEELQFALVEEELKNFDKLKTRKINERK